MTTRTIAGSHAARDGAGSFARGFALGAALALPLWAAAAGLCWWVARGM